MVEGELSCTCPVGRGPTVPVESVGLVSAGFLLIRKLRFEGSRASAGLRRAVGAGFCSRSTTAARHGETAISTAPTAVFRPEIGLNR